MRLIDEDVLAEIIYNKWSNKEITDTKYNTFLALLDEVPTIDPVRHGKWIDYPDCLAYEGAISHEDFVCSECASVWNAIDNESNRFDYCPNCGAKMEEE